MPRNHSQKMVVSAKRDAPLLCLLSAGLFLVPVLCSIARYCPWDPKSAVNYCRDSGGIACLQRGTSVLALLGPRDR